MSEKTKKKIIFDVILVVALLIVALIALLFYRFVYLHEPGEGAYVLVRKDGREVMRYPLDMDGVFSLNGGTNYMVIKDSTVYMESADCPKQICVNTGRIALVNAAIECAHNKIRITIEE